MPSGLSGKVISYECWNYDRASDPALCCGPGGKENGKGQKGRQDMRKLRRKLQRRQVEAIHRLQLRRGQPVAGEGVDMGAGHGELSVSETYQCAAGVAVRKSSRAMMSCCTSVAPS